MNKETYKALHISLNVASIVVLLLIIWQWGAVWPLRTVNHSVEPSLAKACKQIKGCRGIVLSTQWSPARTRYEPFAKIMFSSMSDTDKQNLAAKVQQSFNEEAGRSLFYKSHLRSPGVSFYHG